MKRILIVGAFAFATLGQALAAELPLPPPPVAPPPIPVKGPYLPPPPPFTWSGFYFGANGGYVFGTTDWTSGPATTGNFNMTGFLAGGTIGYNYQLGSFVLGIEGDGDWTDVKGSKSTGVCAAPLSCQTSAEWLATFRARGGYAFNRFLIYVTGGGAYGDEIATLSFPGGSSSASTSKFGWTAGGGVEYAFLPNWSGKVEYLYVDLANGTYTLPPVGALSVKFQENIIRAGINYKFNLF
jgi:outer membrane immunogenic protein